MADVLWAIATGAIRNVYEIVRVLSSPIDPRIPPEHRQQEILQPVPSSTPAGISVDQRLSKDHALRKNAPKSPKNGVTYFPEFKVQCFRFNQFLLIWPLHSRPSVIAPEGSRYHGLNNPGASIATKEGSPW
jgi:hypothetical protein